VEQVNPGYYNSATAQRWNEKPPAAAAVVAPAAMATSSKTSSAGNLTATKAKRKVSEPVIAAPAAILAQSSLAASPSQMPASLAENEAGKR
jgi:hypothetical protein